MTVKRRSSERTHYVGDGCELLPPEHPLVKEHELSTQRRHFEKSLRFLERYGIPGPFTRERLARASADDPESLRNIDVSYAPCPNCGGVDGCYYGCTDHD